MTKILIEAKNLCFHPAHKLRPLYENLEVVLTNKTHFLVGENGCGKSTLAKSLAKPSEQVTHYGIVGYLDQDIEAFDGTVAEKLNISNLMEAFERVENGCIQEKDFELLDNQWDFKATLEKQFKSYGLSISICNSSYSSLSGGMRSRLNLLALERQSCDFYILDEPSNHLDRRGKLWLIEWIKRHPSCLIISHDLTLLEHSNVIFELNANGLKRYQAGWQEYLSSKKQYELSLEKKISDSEKELKNQKIAMQKNKEKLEAKQQKAKKNRHSANQTKLVLNKKKSDSEATNKHLAHLHEKRVNEATEDLDYAKREFLEIKPQSFKVSPVMNTNTRQSLFVSDVILPYGCKKPISFQLILRQHLRLSGNNGTGKSTLLKVINKTIKPTSGTIKTPNSVAFLDQHFSFLNPAASVLDNFSTLSPGLKEVEYRTILSRLNIKRESVLQLVSNLSGGETLKLALACLFSGLHSPTLLLLDEPDNHLDLKSKELLIETLKQYEGIIVIVSHDDKFIEQIGIESEYVLPPS